MREDDNCPDQKQVSKFSMSSQAVSFAMDMMIIHRNADLGHSPQSISRELVSTL